MGSQGISLTFERPSKEFSSSIIDHLEVIQETFAEAGEKWVTIIKTGRYIKKHVWEFPPE